MNGADAVKLVKEDITEKKNEIKVILMDCNMPIMNGFQASLEINDLTKEHNLEEIPIVAITANVTHSDMEQCLKSGMKNFLGKPVSREDLGIMLQKILRIKLV